MRPGTSFTIPVRFQSIPILTQSTEVRAKSLLVYLPTKPKNLRNSEILQAIVIRSFAYITIKEVVDRFALWRIEGDFIKVKSMKPVVLLVDNICWFGKSCAYRNVKSSVSLSFIFLFYLFRQYRFENVDSKYLLLFIGNSNIYISFYSGRPSTVLII